MSGGHFDYKDMRIQDWIDILKEDEYPTEKIENLLGSIMNILHAYDWFQSGDTNEGEFKNIYYKELQNIKGYIK